MAVQHRWATCGAWWTVVLIAAPVATSVEDHASRPKHVLVVVIDDLGFDDLGFRNNDQIATPHFNELARNGITMGSYYVQPSCSPTRATIMTGRKPVHTGINFWIPNDAYGLPLNETTLAQVMNTRGFRSHAIGKWHLGFFKTPYTPTFRGFESFFGYYEGSEDYFAHITSGGTDLHSEERPECGPGCSELLFGLKGVYSTNIYTARALEVISAHNATTPLFMYLAYQGVHAPRQCPQHYVDPYKHSIADAGWRTFAGMVSALDEGLGNVTAALRAKGMLEHTLIVVTTDNGGPTTDCNGIGASNWPYRGSKCSVWEGGTRGTSFLWWDGLPKAVKGSTWPGLAHAADWLPTIASAVGAVVRPNETLPLDGLDLWDALLQGGDSPRKEVYYGISQDHRGPAARDTKGYKLISGSGGGAGKWSPRQGPNASTAASPWGLPTTQVEAPQQWLLYNIVEDEGERHPLSLEEHPEAVARLKAIIQRYEASKVPQLRGDPSCPQYAPRQSPQGPWVGPWCDHPEGSEAGEASFVASFV